MTKAAGFFFGLRFFFGFSDASSPSTVSLGSLVSLLGFLSFGTLAGLSASGLACSTLIDLPSNVDSCNAATAFWMSDSSFTLTNPNPFDLSFLFTISASTLLNELCSVYAFFHSLRVNKVSFTRWNSWTSSLDHSLLCRSLDFLRIPCVPHHSLLQSLLVIIFVLL